jgi:hypothetical protein
MADPKAMSGFSIAFLFIVKDGLWAGSGKTVDT